MSGRIAAVDPGRRHRPAPPRDHGDRIALGHPEPLRQPRVQLHERARRGGVQLGHPPGLGARLVLRQHPAGRQQHRVLARPAPRPPAGAPPARTAPARPAVANRSRNSRGCARVHPGRPHPVVRARPEHPVLRREPPVGDPRVVRGPARATPGAAPRRPPPGRPGSPSPRPAGAASPCSTSRSLRTPSGGVHAPGAAAGPCPPGWSSSPSPPPTASPAAPRPRAPRSPTGPRRTRRGSPATASRSVTCAARGAETTGLEPISSSARTSRPSASSSSYALRPGPGRSSGSTPHTPATCARAAGSSSLR